MKSIMGHLDKAFLFLSDIPVKGDDVEKMAVVRQELRAAYADAEKEAKNEPSEAVAES